MNFLNGLLAHKFNIQNLEIDNVLPSYEEVNIFIDNQKNPDIKKLMKKSLTKLNDPSKRLKKNLQRGDRVGVLKGEYKGLSGVVIDITKDFIKVDLSSKLSSLKEGIRFKSNEIQKIFEVGEKVEILVGRRKGTIGRVMKLTGNLVHLIVENNNEEVVVLSADIKRNDSLGLAKKKIFKREAGLDRFDLVSLNNNRSVGMVLGMGVGDVLILDTEGYSRRYSLVEIGNKLTRVYVGKNPHGQEVKAKYTVKITGGKNKSKI